MRRENTLIIGIICLMTFVVALTAMTYNNPAEKNQSQIIQAEQASNSVISVNSYE